MENINEIINYAERKNNRIFIEMLDKFDIKEDEFVNVIDLLKAHGIVIESENAIDDNINCGDDVETDLVATLINEIKAIPMLTCEQITELFKDMANGDKQAYKKIMRGNLRLVLSMAAKFNANLNNKGSGLGLLDFFQEGCIGMSKAIKKFDVTKGYKFSTYATWWIKQSMYRANIDKSRIIRIPVHEMEFIHKLRKFIANHAIETGSIPTYEQMAAEMNVTEEKISQSLVSQEYTLSLEQPIGSEKDTALGEFVLDESFDDYDKVEQKMCYDQIFEAIESKLNTREQYILKHRYGLEDGRVWSLGELGINLNITRERVRQIELKALKKLRVFCKANFDEEEEIALRR